MSVKRRTLKFKKSKQKGYAMSDGTVIDFKKKGPIGDALCDLLKEGAQKMLMLAVESEIETFIERYKNDVTSTGQRSVVRNGYLPERTLQTGVGHLSIKVPRTRDRSGGGRSFHSVLLPPYLKRAKNIEELLPVLYLKGISSNDFPEALESLLGPQSKGLSSGTIGRLKEKWALEFKAFQEKTFFQKRYAYLYADGVYFQTRLSQRQCMLVLLGVDETGKKELLALEGGVRESEDSWYDLLLRLKDRGLQKAPCLAIGDGALGFWKALHKAFEGKTDVQRCWFHKASNVLNQLPRSLQTQANKGLKEIWMAPTKKEAEEAMGRFVKTYQAKYPKATECLQKDREDLLRFYSYPAVHWRNLRTTNAIESVFATVKLRTAKTRGCLSQATAEMMAFKLMESASQRWIRLADPDKIRDLLKGCVFVDGEKIQTKKEPNNTLRSAA